MWSTTKYASLLGPIVGVPLAYFVLFTGVYNFPYHSFRRKIFNFASVLSKKSAATITFANF